MTPTISETMRAAVLRDVADDMRVETIHTPWFRVGEVLVRVFACGMCHLDLHAISGAIAFPTPCVLGHEAAGEVVEIGSYNEHSGLIVGGWVAGGLLMPCGRCESCAADRSDLCESFLPLNRLRGRLYGNTTRLLDLGDNSIWIYSMGRLVEYCVIPSTSVARLSDGIGPVTGAVLGCAAMTTYGMVWRGTDLCYDGTVVVVATGSVGSSVTQIAKALGARRTVAIDATDDKLTAAVELGATDTVNSAKVDTRGAVTELTGGQDVDVAFEVLGQLQTWLTALDVLRDGDRIVPIGLGAGVQKVEVEINRTVRRSQLIIGSYGARTRRDLPKVARITATGVIDCWHIVSRHYGPDRVTVSYQQLHGGQITGRAVVDVSS